MSVEEAYDCLTRTPMGELTSTFSVRREGDDFTGRHEGTLGAMDVYDGRIEGNRLTWKMDMTSPMPMTLDCDAVIEGDRLTGNVRAPGFGSMPMSGTRVGVQESIRPA